MGGRDDVLLEPILRLLLKHVADPRFGDMVCDVAGIVIGTLNLFTRRKFWYSSVLKICMDPYWDNPRSSTRFSYDFERRLRLSFGCNRTS